MPIKYVLFDHDGTLLSTLAVRSRSLEHAMREVMGREIDGEAVFAETHGQSLYELGAYLTDNDAAKMEALVTAYRAHYYVANQAGFDPYDGIPETIGELHARGIPMAVVTSKKREGAHDELTGCGLAQYFRFMVGSDDVEKHKPNAEPLIQAMAAIGADPAQTLMVGDTTADVGGAKNAGTFSAAAMWGTQDADELRAAEPDYLLDDPRQILDLLET